MAAITKTLSLDSADRHIIADAVDYVSDPESDEANGEGYTVDTYQQVVQGTDPEAATIEHPLFRRTAQSSGDVLAAPPLVEFDVEIAGIEYGLIDVEKNGIVTRSLKPPDNPTLWPENVKKLDVTGEWTPQSLSSFAGNEQPVRFTASGEPVFDLAFQFPTPLRQLLWTLCYLEFVPILNIYKDDPERLQYAGKIFNHVIECLDRASRLGEMVIDAPRTPDDFLAAVENYYRCPSEQDATRMPLARVRVERVMMSRVDDRHLLDAKHLRAADDIVQKTDRLRKSFVRADKALRAERIEESAKLWSEYFYDEGILPGPVPGNLLPSELEAEIVPPFERRDSRHFLNSLVPYQDSNTQHLAGAESIVRDFSGGLRRVLNFFETTALPLKFQVMTQDVKSSDDFLSPHLELIDQHELINKLPTAETAARFATDAVHDLDVFSDSQAAIEANEAFLNGSPFRSLAEDLEMGWQAIGESLVSPGDEITPTTFLAQKFSDGLRDFYFLCGHYWVAIVTMRIPPSMLWSYIHNVLYEIENLDDSAETEVYKGMIITGCERKQFFRTAVVAILTAFADKLREHQDAVYQSFEEAYQDVPERREYFQRFKDVCTQALWFFDTWAKTYSAYVDSVGQQSEEMDVAVMDRRTPYILSILDEGQETLRVLDEVEQVTTRCFDEPALCLNGWGVYESLCTEINQFTNPEMSQTTVRYLEERATDAELLAALAPLEREENKQTGESLKTLLFTRYPEVESSAWKILPPLEAKAFLNRLRSVINVVVYLEQMRVKSSERAGLDLSEEVQRGLIDWYGQTPYGWPRSDGTTPQGNQLDAHFFPDPLAHLTPDVVVSYFLPDSPVSEDQAISSLTFFFADYNRGFTRYFLTGGLYYNSQGHPVAFSQSMVFLNKFLLLLDDWAKIAEVQLERGVPKTEEERTDAHRVLRISRQLMFNIRDEIETNTTISFYALINRDGTFSGIVPSRLDHSFDPVIDLGTSDEELALRASRIIEMGHYDAQGVIIDSSQDFDLHEQIPVTDTSDAADYGRYEEYLSACPRPEVYDDSWWIIRTSGLHELQYIYGRLLEVADPPENGGFEERRQQLVTDALRAPVANLRRLPGQLEDGTFADPKNVSKYHAGLRRHLPTLSTAERLWLAGELSLRLAASDAFDRDGNILMFSYEDARIASIDAYLKTFSRAKATELLKRISKEYGSNYEDFRKYFDDSEHRQAWRRRKKVFELCNGDEIHKRAGRGNVLTNPELLYLTLLLAHDVCRADTAERMEKLAAEMVKDDPAAFSLAKVLGVYRQISDEDKKEFYPFVYYRSLGYYQDGITEALKRRANVFHTATASEECGLWDFFREVPSLVSITGESPSFVFSLDQLSMIVASWEYSGVQPTVPKKAQTDAREFFAFLESVLDDPDFFERNETVLVNHVLADAGMKPADQATLWQRYSQKNRFTQQETRAFNQQIFGAIHPLFTQASASRRNTVQAVDQPLQDVLAGWADVENINDLVLDPQTQIVVANTLTDLEGLYRTASQHDPRYTQVADAYAELHDILLGQYDTSSPVTRSFYSRYNPNGRRVGVEFPSDLATLYSRYFFVTLTGIEDPHLVYSVEPMLSDVRHILESGEDEEGIRTIISGWDDFEALQCLSHAFRQHYATYTTAFYIKHDFDRVPLVREQISRIQSNLDNRIAALVRKTEGFQSAGVTSGIWDERGLKTLSEEVHYE